MYTHSIDDFPDGPPPGHPPVQYTKHGKAEITRRQVWVIRGKVWTIVRLRIQLHMSQFVYLRPYGILIGPTWRLTESTLRRYGNVWEVAVAKRRAAKEFNARYPVMLEKHSVNMAAHLRRTTQKMHPGPSVRNRA